MTNKKIVILDFGTGEVHAYPFDENIWADGEEFIASENEEECRLSLNNCQWMIVEDLNIQIH